MRIVQVSRDATPNGGLAVYVRRLCGALADAGHDVSLLHADAAAPRVAGITAQIAAPQSHFAIFDPATNPTTAPDALAILERLSPEVVHIHDCHNFALQQAVQCRFPTVKTLHVYDDFCPAGNKFHHLGARQCRHRPGAACVPRMVYKRCVRSRRPAVIWMQYRRAVEAARANTAVDRLIVASDHVCREAVASGYAADRISVIPYFTELPSETLPVGSGPAHLLFVGRLVREKGVDRLLRAIRHVPGDWRLTIAGDGPDRPRLARIARRLALGDRVEVVGWANGDTLARLYDRSRAVIVPSLWPEPFGIVGIEAMSRARPVVAFAVGGIPEWLDDGCSGFLVAPGDEAQLGARIGALVQRPDLAQRMGQAGRARVERDFGAALHVRAVTAVYDMAIARRQVGAA